MVAPLCWGLGHATRCIPIIDQLLKKNCHVDLASDGEALLLLQKTFPSLQSFGLPPYDIKYSGENMVRDMLRQLHKIYSAYRKEKTLIKKLQQQHKWDFIISDHRYGVASPTSKNIIVCHQVQIQSDNSLAQSIANTVHHKLLNEFDTVWIPDFEDHKLAGVLSHTQGIRNYSFIGPLSRLITSELTLQYDLLVILSGPEPARTIFENALLPILVRSDKKIALIRGTTSISSSNFGNLDVHNFLYGSELNQLINVSDTVLSRAGYSSIMDYVTLNKKAILIPTPGQTEQEYLGEWHKENECFTVINQSQLDQLDILLST